MGKRNPHALLSQTAQNHQHLGEMGPQESESPLDLFNTDPLVHSLDMTNHSLFQVEKKRKIQPKSFSEWF